MQITGSYNNYLILSNLLAPLGVKNSGNLIMGVFTSSMNNLQNKIDNQIFSKESAVAINQLGNMVAGLSSKAKKLTLTDMHSVFNDRSAISSDSNVLTASAYDVLSPDTGAEEASYNISVAQIAQNQENIGLELNKADASGVNLGTNTYNINVNGQDYELSIEVMDGDTNEAVLQKMATAVNEAGIGVTAKVVAGSGAETQQLVISSDNTGLAAAFSVSDISGNAIAATAVEIVSSEAQDAQYTIDGTGYTSGSNTISLDDGMVTVNLKGVGESTLEIAPDANTVKNTISALVSEINALVGFLESNSDYIKDEVLSSVNAYIDDHHSKLETFGITLGDDGKLGIDNTKLTEAIDQNPAGIKETFAGFDGLAVQFNNYASRITTDNPFNYAKEADNMDLYSMGQTYSLSAATSKNLLEGTLLNMIV